jgi:hypothetical protein
MIDLPPSDPIVALWQTAPKPDTRLLLHDLQRQERMHRRFNRVLVAIVGAISLLLLLEEITGRVATHGWLSASWIVCLAAGLIWRDGIQRHHSGDLNVDTVTLLKSSVRQAQKDLFLARCLYAGVPCGAICGFLIMQLAAQHGSAPPLAADPGVRMIQTGAGIIALVAMMLSGAVLASSRRIQARELGDKLKSMESDL